MIPAIHVYVNRVHIVVDVNANIRTATRDRFGREGTQMTELASTIGARPDPARSPDVPVRAARGRRRRRRAGRSWAGLGFVAPFLAVFALVFIAPIVYSLYLSLYRTKLI